MQRTASPKKSHARGMTIFELLIAITISLILLAVMMVAFRRASSEISKGRAIMELASQLRTVGEMLRTDIRNGTVVPGAFSLSNEPEGYLAVIEGPLNDDSYRADATTIEDNYIGDVDDILALTVRSQERPFRGRWVDAGGNTQMVESHVAEIVWFVVHQDIDETNGLIDLDDRVTLYRRVLLVRPDLLLTDSSGTLNMDTFFLANDISARPVGGSVNRIVANSLDDLTRRQNRYAHNAASFPHLLQRAWLANRRLAQGEDIVLTDVCGFDIRVYSPNAPVKSDGEFVLQPGESNYGVNTMPTVSQGAYVDLGWNGTGWFSGLANLRSGLTATWDSWTPHYEYNGVDDDGNSVIDQGTNGLDDDGDGVVDEEDERETQPPYAQPIRALQFRLKAIEKTTASVRQLTIMHSFVPE